MPGTAMSRTLLVLFTTLIANAQPQAPELTSHDTPAAFQAKLNLVLVPVVVRDRQGRVVGNLGKEDFQLFDKGKPQITASFSVEKPGGRALSLEQTPEQPAGKPPTLPERYIAYLFDDVHLRFGDLAHVRDAAGRHLAAALDDTARAAIFSTSGRTMLDFTDDRAKLQETLLRLQPRSIASTGMPECPDVSHYMADLIRNKNDAQALMAATLEVLACMHLDPKTQMQIAQDAARTAATRALTAGEAETRLALGVLKDAVRRISAMPGRRTVLLISPGFLTLDAGTDKTEILDRAIRSKVVISALDARGLYTIIPGGDASTQTNDLEASRIKSQYEPGAALQQADVMAELAEGTGGGFFHNNNDLYAGLNHLAAAPESIYVLGFSPQNLKLDGRFHSLKVTLKNSNDLTIQARRGYYAPTHLADAAEEARREIEEALFSKEEMQELPVELHTQFFKPTDVTAKLAVLVRLDLKAIRFRKADGRNLNNLTIVSALFDRNGNYVTGIQKLVEMRLRDETLQAKLASGITVRTSLDVKPGSYSIRLVVRDAEGQLMSARNGAVEIP